MGRHGRVERYPLPEQLADWPEPALAYYVGQLDRLRYNAVRRAECRRLAEQRTRQWWALGRGGVPPAWPARCAAARP